MPTSLQRQLHSSEKVIAAGQLAAFEFCRYSGCPILQMTDSRVLDLEHRLRQMAERAFQIEFPAFACAIGKRPRTPSDGFYQIVRSSRRRLRALCFVWHKSRCLQSLLSNPQRERGRVAPFSFTLRGYLQPQSRTRSQEA
jgi:hypothetical protein